MQTDSPEITLPYSKEINMPGGDRILLFHIDKVTEKLVPEPNLNIYRVGQDGAVKWRIAHPLNVPTPTTPYSDMEIDENSPLQSLLVTWRSYVFIVNPLFGTIIGVKSREATKAIDQLIER